jgi:hypothetical protein
MILKLTNHCITLKGRKKDKCNHLNQLVISFAYDFYGEVGAKIDIYYTSKDSA